jgi:putative nucleotidyltransferase with HDIG domain
MTTEQIRLKLTNALTNIDSLPAMPAIALKLMALNLNTEEGEAELLKLIGQDPQISAKMISLANSPMMGLSRKVNTLPEAAMLLGLTRVKTVSLGIAAMSNFAQLPGTKNFSPQYLWLHNLSIAIAMNTLSLAMPRQMRPPQDHLYLAGLLHDMGYMAIHHIDAEASNERLFQFAQQPNRHILEIEQEVLGISHCQIGATLAKQWNLPEEIIDVLHYHHTPYEDEVPTQNTLPYIIHLAEKLLPNFGINEYCGTEIAEREWQTLGIDPDQSEELRETINEIAIQASQMADIL